MSIDTTLHRRLTAIGNKKRRDENLPVYSGEVKWFDEFGKRFGFIIPDVPNEWNKEVFFAWQILRDCAIRESHVQPEGRVEFQQKPPARQGLCPETTWLRLL